MARFDDFLSELQTRAGLVPIPLIRAWQPNEIIQIESAIRQAVAASGMIGAQIPNFVGTNQAKGNRAAEFFADSVRPNLPIGTALEEAGGGGYPDHVFRLGQVGYGLELKATANWRNNDAIRRVLTASPTKMRQLIGNGRLASPPAHLIVTVIYAKATSTVTSLRLDFLEPDSVVEVRLEAYTSQKLLANGAQTVATIP